MIPSAMYLLTTVPLVKKKLKCQTSRILPFPSTMLRALKANTQNNINPGNPEKNTDRAGSRGGQVV